MRRVSRKFLNRKVLNKLRFFTVISLFILICAKGYAQAEYILDEDCVYISDGYITSCNCSNNDYIKLVIPETLNGQAVKGIADNPSSNYPVFHMLTNIADIEFPNTMEYIGDNVNISIPYQVETIDFPESLKYIGDHAFGSSGIDSIIFPDNLEHIGSKAFNWCYLKSIYIPSSVTYIGNGAFNGNNISYINGEASNGLIYARNSDGTINYQQIVSYGGANKHVDFIPDTVRYLSDNSFDACYLGSVALPDSLKTIGSYAFRSNGLTNINIPSGVDHIGDFAFEVNSLESVLIPDTLYHLGVAAFNRNKIQEVNGQQSNGLFYARNALGLESYDTIVSYGGISDTVDFIPDMVTHINEFTFDYQKLYSVVLPADLEYIGDYAFRGNYLDAILLPESVSYIGKQALYNNSLSTIVLPESLSCIEDFSLANNSLDTIILPASLSYIGIYALNGNDFSEFILPVSNTHELLYWIDNNDIRYNGGDTISNMSRTYSALLGDPLYLYGTLNQVACDTFLSPSSNYIWTQSGIYNDTIPGSFERDSIIKINLTINNSTAYSIAETFCGSYTSPSGQVWTVPDTYIDIIPNEAGCDSIISIDLTIDCSNSISNNSILPVSIYPNPFNDIINIELDEICDHLTLEIYDLTGQLISRDNFKNTKQVNYKIKCESGYYILKLSDNKGKLKVVELIKQ
jgi:hypothetical protein